jgi:hypothetical protein
VIRLLAHRGMWALPEERNSRTALASSFTSGFGVETDVRDGAAGLVISHDPPAGGEPAASELVTWARGHGLPVAVNVKADGLSAQVAALFAGSDVDWFAFDMSVPETLRYAAAGLPYLTRHSDVEPEPVLYAGAAGVWLDAFHSDWFGPDEVRRHLDAGKRVAVVSPELHGRPPERQWDWLAGFESGPDEDLMICTDHPLRLGELLEDRT